VAAGRQDCFPLGRFRRARDLRRWLHRSGGAPKSALQRPSEPITISELDLSNDDALASALMNAVLEDTFRPLSVIHDAPTRVYEDPHQPVGEPPSSRAALLRLPKHAQDRWSSSLDEELGALGIKNVFGPSVSYGEREPGVPVIHTNTIFTKKAPDHEGRVRLKARLVALGNQEPLDPEERTASPTIIPALVKIMAAVGLTRQLEERGSHLPSGPTTMTAFDIATAFLNGDMEDKRTYVSFMDPSGRTITAPLIKPLYGLRVAPLRWHEKFTADVAAFGLRPFKLNPCVFTNDDGSILLGLHVDDGFLVASAADRDRFLSYLRTCYGDSGVTAHDMQAGPRIYCGVRWTYEATSHTFRLDQHDTITQLLEDFGMLSKRPASIPAPSDAQLLLDPEAGPDPRFQQLVGRLLWISASTRADIAWATKELCRHTLHTSSTHWTYARQVLSYLAGSVSEVQVLRSASNFDLRAWADSSYAESDDRRSSSGIVISLGPNAIYWKAFTQTNVATSSCQAELNGFFEAALLVDFYRACLSFLGARQGRPTPLHVDSMSALQLLAKRVPAGRSKHVGVRYFHILDCIDRDQLMLQWVSTTSMIPDVLTKPLARVAFQSCIRPMLDGRMPTPERSARSVTGTTGTLSAPKPRE
jgi:hypothetical protein